MLVPDRLLALRLRFNINEDRHFGPKDVAVVVCSTALDLVADETESNYPDAITAAIGTLPDEIRLNLARDSTLRLATLATVSGMMDCLTTEWHN